MHLYPAQYRTDLIFALSSCQPRLRGPVFGSALSSMDSAGLFDARRGRRASQKTSVNLIPDCFPTSKMHCSLPDQQRKDLHELLHKILRLLESKAYPRVICTVRLVKSKTYESRPKLHQIVMRVKKTNPTYIHHSAQHLTKWRCSLVQGDILQDFRCSYLKSHTPQLLLLSQGPQFTCKLLAHMVILNTILNTCTV